MNAIISQGPIYSRLAAPPAAIDVVRAALTVERPKAQFSRSYKYGMWDGTIKFLRRPHNIFLTGLTHRVVEILKHHGFVATVQYADYQRRSNSPFVPQLNGITLRDYQLQAAEWAVMKARTAIESPTGSGKTEIGAEIIRRFGLPTLWLTHRKVLMHQTAERLMQLLAPNLVAKSDEKNAKLDMSRPILVGMVPTLSRWPSNSLAWRRWKVLIVDECQHASSDSWAEVASKCINAPYRFGLSGTVLTDDPVKNMRLEGITGPLFVAAETKELVSRGFLATPLIKIVHPWSKSFPTYEQVRDAVYPEWRKNPRGLKHLGGKLYAKMYLDGIVNNSHHLDSIVRVVGKHPEEKILILFRDIESHHGQTIYKKLDHRQVLYADGSTTDDKRNWVLNYFKECAGGAVLVASTIFDQGVDIPEIDVLVLAGGGQSHITTLQRVGRALRPRPEKATVLIYDIWAGQEPGGKDYLANHSAAREQEYVKQGFDVEHVFI